MLPHIVTLPPASPLAPRLPSPRLAHPRCSHSSAPLLQPPSPLPARSPYPSPPDENRKPNGAGLPPAPPPCPNSVLCWLIAKVAAADGVALATPGGSIPTSWAGNPPWSPPPPSPPPGSETTLLPPCHCHAQGPGDDTAGRKVRGRSAVGERKAGGLNWMTDLAQGAAARDCCCRCCTSACSLASFSSACSLSRRSSCCPASALCLPISASCGVE